MMDRRTFLSGTLVITAETALAQQRTRQPFVAVLSAASEEAAKHGPVLPNLLAGLQDHGYEPGRTMRVEMRFADGNVERLRSLADELVALQPDVIVTNGTPGVRAAVAAAAGRIPIVISAVAETTIDTLVQSFGRPGGTVTGLTIDAPEQDAKCIQLLKECVPSAQTVAVLINPDNPVFKGFVGRMSKLTRRLELELFEVGARSPRDFSQALAAAQARGAGALLAMNDGLLVGTKTSRAELASQALAARLATAATVAGFARDGGLMTLSTDSGQLARRAAWYVHRILEGESPAVLPVERPTRVTFSLNLKTARALGLTLPSSLLLRADEVIE